MGSDPELLSAMERAVSTDPDNTVLRLHLADLLLAAERPTDALTHVEIVLASQPDHVAALGLAAKAGEAAGDSRAPGWARLYSSLAPQRGTQDLDDVPIESASESEPHATPKRATAFNEEEGSVDWDAFLEEVLQEAGHLPTVTLTDVGGLVDVKERLNQSFLTPLRNPEFRRQYGAHLRGGLMLWGPPGCGKTFLARAVAGELGARFMSIGLHQVLDMWLGNSEKHLHGAFEMARRHPPCVVFFDEIDAIGHTRMNLGRSAARNVVAQLLVELDGIDTSNEGLFVIGATNQPWDVDPGLRRPGRFDRTMLVLPPDETGRIEILRAHLSDRPIGEVDYVALARATDGFSGADLRLVCDDAAELALSDAVRSSTIHPIDMAHLLKALKGVKPSTAAWFESARNHVRYANQDGQYDELAAYLKRHRPR